MLEKHHLHKIETINTQANKQLNQLAPLKTNGQETWQDFCQSTHALLDLALGPGVSAEERGYAWSHLQHWRTWGIQRV